MGFPGGSEVKASACNAGDLGSISVLGRSPGEGNGNPLQYSCLENPMDREAWWATVHGVAKNRTQLLELVKLLSPVRLFATPWTVAYQASLSMGFSRQEHWSGLPFPSPMHKSGK